MAADGSDFKAFQTVSPNAPKVKLLLDAAQFIEDNDWTTGSLFMAPKNKKKNFLHRWGILTWKEPKPRVCCRGAMLKILNPEYTFGDFMDLHVPLIEAIDDDFKKWTLKEFKESMSIIHYNDNEAASKKEVVQTMRKFATSYA